MNLQNVFPLVPPYFWDTLRELAKSDWMDAVPDPTGDGPNINLFTHRIKDATANSFVEEAFSGALSHYGGGLKACMWLYSLSRVIGEGPKVFRATAEQCQALEHVEVNIPLRDYRQPYPTMLVEFPSEYLRSVDERTAGKAPKAPRFVILRHWQAGVLFSGASVMDVSGLPAELLYTFGGKVSDKSLEAGLTTEVMRAPDPGEAALVEMLTRVSINLSLLLTQSTTKLVPSDAAGLDKARRNAAKGIKPEVNRREVSEHINFVVPDRNVVVRKTRWVGVDPAAGQGPFTPVSTHWVRGHWRAYPGHAEARRNGQQVPLLFVNPYLVVGEGAAPCPVYSVPN